MGHIDNFKKWGNKVINYIEEQEGARDIMSVPDEFKAENDVITQHRNSIVQIETNLATQKKQLNDLVTALQGKIAAKNSVDANAVKTAPAPAMVPPTV